jgi:hypothetical protein
MTASITPRPATAASIRVPRSIVSIAVIWLALAVVAGASGFLGRLPFPGPQVIILALTALTIAAGLVPGRARAWIESLPIQWLVGINVFRLIGGIFLFLAAQGQMSPIFAARAGWGDIATALLAVALVTIGAPRTPQRRLLFHAWNAFGLLDLVVAVGTATAVTLAHTTPGMAPILAFPLSLVPTVAVPIFLANHVFIYRRLRAAGRTAR